MSSSPPDELRPPRDDDFAAIHELFREQERVAHGAPETTAEELRTWLTAPTVDPERDVRLAFAADRLVGYVDVDRVDGEPVRWWSDVRVLPGVDPAAMVPALVGWTEERAASGGIVRLWAGRGETGVRAAFEGLGFRRTRSSYRMEIELGEDVPAPEVSAGLELRPLGEGEERAAYLVHQEAFEDSWEHTPEPFEEWRHWLVDNESFDPTLWFLVWDGSEPAAAALCRDREGVGWVSILAVRRPWRRRGLGRALLLHVFREFAARGFGRVGLGVDAESLTGANRLYEAVGMRVTRELEFFEKTLPPS